MTTHPDPLSEAAGELRAGERDLHAYLEEVCDRIDEIDGELRAFCSEVGRRERLHAEAADLLERHPDPGDRPPLFGVPVGVKDIIHADGFTTRAGSALPPELIQGEEATVVSELREAGALVAGKTVTTEFAGGAPGLTRNPHDLEHTPGGSSSGSAAAVAAGLCPLALGTQTGGSVIRPAAFCGVVGFKPTYDRIPTAGVIPRSETLDHVGLLAQDVPGIQLAASVACGDWEPAGAGTDGRPTLGVPEGPYLERASAAALDAFERQLDRLEERGYGLERAEVFGDFEETDGRRHDVAWGELALVHDEWFDEYEPFYRTTPAERIRAGREVTTKQLADGRAVRRERREELEAAMDAEGIDLWVSPAAPGPAPPTIATTGNSVMNRPWTDSGFPTVTLPAGTVDGLPVGLQCAAEYGADERLLEWAEPLAATLREGTRTA